MTKDEWSSVPPDQLLQQLESSLDGLSTTQATQRIAEYGPNIIPGARSRSLFSMLLSQFTDFMILVLLVAAVISGIIGEPQDTIAIVIIVLINAVIGTVQEYRAERAVAALREIAAPEARAFRDGQLVTLSASELVPGDVIMMEAGNIVPADVRLLEIEELEINESALTGESEAVRKNVESKVEPGVSSERENLAFKSSIITRGQGKGIVVATGLETEIGNIANLLRSELRVKTPLQERLTRFGRFLALAVLAICMVVFIAGLMQGNDLIVMFLTAVSLAVAAIPEALPAVVTIALAMGAHKLIRHKALVRKLPAVESLGSVTYICADKTGTLTQNQMTVERFFVGGEYLEALQGIESSLLSEYGRAMALNNDVIMTDGEAAGEPTELALFNAAMVGGFDKQELEQSMPRLAAIPFDSDRKMMTTLHSSNGGVVAYVKGAPEQLLGHCSHAYAPGETFSADNILAEAESLAAEGYRVLALARREFSETPDTSDIAMVESDLSFLGLVALIDPPRPEAEQAVMDCRTAGITPVMITGDHPGTAQAIARRLGIMNDANELITGDELAALSDKALAQRVDSVQVYARVSPEQKLRIIKALQANGEFVAMTGDGVNDAPALKRAGIGVAMGVKGTDVAREAADMVLLDDNFATIVRAVKEGRRIFDNIRKFIKDTMSSNSGEIWTLFLAPFLGLPIPLLPIHILWINLVTDGLPGLAFTAEPAEPNIMKRKPRSPQENIFAHGMWQHIIWVGLFVGGVSIASQAWAVSRGVEYWQTIVFTVLTVSQLFHSLAVRSESASLFTIGIFTNWAMLGAVLLAVLLQMAVIYLPMLNNIFHTQPLPLYDLMVCFALSSLVLVVVEIEKWLMRRGLIYANSGN